MNYFDHFLGNFIIGWILVAFLKKNFAHVFQEVDDFTSQFTAVDSLESKPLKGLRIGLIRETLDNGVDGEVSSAIRAAASHLEELGCSINEVYFHLIPLLLVLYFLVD